MRTLLLAHLMAIGIWIGCILVEAVFEHTIPKNGGLREIVADLHVRVDVWVETPAFLIVLATGLAMLPGVGLTTWFVAKIAIGLLAVLVNAWCVWIVVRRRTLAHGGDIAAFDAIDHLQHKAGGALLVLIAVALGIGATSFVG